MNLNQAQLAGLNALIRLNGGTLTFRGSSVSVYKSAYTDRSNSMDSEGLGVSLDNLFVMARSTEVASWGLKPFIHEVTLDGVAYMTGKTVTTTGPATTIWLREKL